MLISVNVSLGNQQEIKDFVWSSTTRACECDKHWEIDDYLKKLCLGKKYYQ